MKEKNKIEIRELTIANGMDYPSDEELIMLILGKGTKDLPVEQLSQKVMDVIMSSNSDKLVENLTRLKGMGKSRSLAIAAALELGKRQNRKPQVRLQEPKDVIPYIQSYAVQPTEHFLCVSMNGAKEILSIRVICSGSGNMAVIRTGEVFIEALKERASAIVLCHNHPGGNPQPSQEDIDTTRRLYAGASLMGLALLDHIIITGNSYYSFLEHDWFHTFDKENN